MKENHEIMSDEELKQFFLNEAMLLCHSARLESGECEKLWILHNRLKRMNKLLGYLHHQDLGMNLLELQEVYGFYFVEKEGMRKKKHQMNEHLCAYSQFMTRLMKFSDIIACYCTYNVRHLRSLDRVIHVYFPEQFEEKLQAEMKQQELNRVAVEK